MILTEQHKINDAALVEKITSLKYKFYVTTGSKKMLLMSNAIEGMDAVTSDQTLGDISGSLLKDTDIDKAWVVIKIEKRNNKKKTYHIDLDFEKVADISKNKE